MKRVMSILLIVIICMSACSSSSQMTEEDATPEEVTKAKQVLSQAGYDKTAPAIVKLVSDEGRRIGSGLVVGIHEDSVGFILTSYSLVAGRNKVAVILKDFPDPLLGHVIESWIDFDTDLAIIGVKNYPSTDLPTITLAKEETLPADREVTVVGHTEQGDWMPVPVTVSQSDESHVTVSGLDYTGIEGAPILDDNGNVLAMIVTEALESSASQNLTLAVKNTTIQPIIKTWLESIPLAAQWQTESVAISPWVWAVGAGVVGATVATTIAITGGEEGPRPLPRAPEPPTTPSAAQKK